MFAAKTEVLIKTMAHSHAIKTVYINKALFYACTEKRTPTMSNEKGEKNENEMNMTRWILRGLKAIEIANSLSE